MTVELFSGITPIPSTPSSPGFNSLVLDDNLAEGNAFNAHLILAAKTGSIQVVKCLLNSKQCKIDDLLLKSLLDVLTTKPQLECLELIKSCRATTQATTRDTRIATKKTGNVLQTLSFDILVMIASYIRSGSTLIRWLKALKNYPTIGDLYKILQFQTAEKLSDNDLWPILTLRNKLDFETSQRLASISSFFTSIRFMNVFEIDLINAAVPSTRPQVELYMNDKTTDECKFLAVGLQDSRCNRLRFDGMTDRKLDQITKFLSSKGGAQNAKLVDLEFFGIFSVKSVGKFATALQDSFVKKLKFHGRLDSESICALAAILKDSQLTDLTLFESTIDAQTALVLANGLKDSKITTFMLDDNSIDDEGLTHISSVLKDTKIRELCLSDCNITSNGCKTLAQNLEGTTVESLDIFGNGEIELDGLISLSQSLPATKINELSLGSLSLDLNGMRALSMFLPKSNLKDLVFSCSTFTLEMIQTLIVALPRTKVKNLTLSACDINDEMATTLLSNLHSTKIETLDLSDNDISSTSTTSINNCMTNKTRLRSLNISDNRIDFEDILKLVSTAHHARVDLDSDFPRSLNNMLENGNLDLVYNLASVLVSQF